MVVKNAGYGVSVCTYLQVYTLQGANTLLGPMTCILALCMYTFCALISGMLCTKFRFRPSKNFTAQSVDLCFVQQSRTSHKILWRLPGD